jgi:hypothetical protein
MQQASVSNSSQDFEPLINTKTAANLLGGMHPKTLEKKARGGEIPAHFIFGHWQYRKSELDNWVQSTIDSRSQSVRLESGV